ncbi:MAG: GatB/YqeY domain-containing protein [Stappiaceae bacterium]
MREHIHAELKAAIQNKQKRKTAMLRLILTALDDRVLAARKQGKDGLSDHEVKEMLYKMISQREHSARAYDEAGQIDLAQQEREEIDVISALMPKQLDAEQVRSACRNVIDELGAEGLRDIGKAMNALKQRYDGQMDFGRASGVVKDMLRCD